MYFVSQCERGLRVATVEMPHMASVTVGIWIGVGGRYERAERSGAAHFIEHLLFKGTARRTAREISEAVEGVGGSLNAFTTEEQTCFHARAAGRHFPELLNVLGDMLLHSRFAPGDVRKERAVIKEEIAMYRDQPSQFVHDLLHEAMWPRQPLGRPLTGTEESLDRLGRGELLEFFGEHYVSGNTLVVAAGPLRHAEVVRACRALARRLRAGRRAACPPAVAQQTAPVICQQRKPTEQTQLALGVRACSRHDDRRFALRVLNAIVGENMSSRLFQILREEKGLAYNVYSAWAFMEDTGALSISAGLEHDDVARALRIIVRELRRLTREPVGPGELRRARDFVIGQLELGLEGTENQMNWLGEALLGYGRVIRPEETKDRLARVMAAEVRRVAEDLFRPQHLTLALVSPLEKPGRLAPLLNW